MIALTFDTYLQFQIAPAIPITYVEAIDLRLSAEMDCTPDAYEKAAAAFESLGMIESAQRCRDRADHYRSIS